MDFAGCQHLENQVKLYMGEKMKEELAALKEQRDVRQNLIRMKELVKEDSSAKKLLNAESEDSLWEGLLQHEDAKVRKNTALMIGELGRNELLEALFSAYKKEQQLFVKSSYLKAMQKFDCSSYLEQLKEIYRTLLEEEPPEENKKHIRQELRELEILLSKEEGHKRHSFCGYDIESEVVLTTDKGYAGITAEQVKNARVAVSSTGVKVRTKNLKPVTHIRTFREMLFGIHCKEKIEKEPNSAAGRLLESDLMELLSQHLKGQPPYYFRMNILSPMETEEKNAFLKQVATGLEEKSGRRLINSANDYEIEIRFIQSKDGTFQPYLKFYTMPMERFRYRKNALPVSIHPAQAALLMRLALPYLSEDACVLDPFCGVGTMLIERKAAYPAKALYGVDTYGDAIQGARENTELAGENIHYVHRDFFDFTHRDKFDELIANMPAKGKKTKEEQDTFYRQFFEKAGTLLKKRGIMVLYTNETGFVKKQLRLHREFGLLKEYCIREKEGYCLFIIETKE